MIDQNIQFCRRLGIADKKFVYTDNHRLNLQNNVKKPSKIWNEKKKTLISVFA